MYQEGNKSVNDLYQEVGFLVGTLWLDYTFS